MISANPALAHRDNEAPVATLQDGRLRGIFTTRLFQNNSVLQREELGDEGTSSCHLARRISLLPGVSPEYRMDDAETMKSMAKTCRAKK